MVTVRIRLNGDIEKAKRLVNIANTYLSDVDLICGRYCFDCKSFLATLSLDLNHPMEVRLISDIKDEERRFDSEMSEFAQERR